MNEARSFRAGIVQLRAGVEVARNVDDACALIAEAKTQGADFVATPENTNLMTMSRKELAAKTAEEDDDAGLEQFRKLTKDLGIWLLLGGMAMKAGERFVNRSYLIAPDGGIAARYDKMHMFDVDLPGGERYRESGTYRAGGHPVLANLPWGGLGMTICYDLRFPGLYRALAQAGAAFLTVPSGFTKVTGEAHWHVLLRARAIENGCFVFAPAQGGEHESGRVTYGHSLVVDPWGRVIAEAGIDPGVIVAEIDPMHVVKVRERLPVLSHDRDIGPVEKF